MQRAGLCQRQARKANRLGPWSLTDKTHNSQQCWKAKIRINPRKPAAKQFASPPQVQGCSRGQEENRPL
ncbi:T-Cell Immunoglobulin And Mucin Domain-Containing Protein 4 [Manis pentadactyla]|nr:T-Cell Immunoglobulin And Mucin Domain-Containing Protein 4 [Manis pentadactyla]